MAFFSVEVGTSTSSVTSKSHALAIKSWGYKLSSSKFHSLPHILCLISRTKICDCKLCCFFSYWQWILIHEACELRVNMWENFVFDYFGDGRITSWQKECQKQVGGNSWFSDLTFGGNSLRACLVLSEAFLHSTFLLGFVLDLFSKSNYQRRVMLTGEATS